MLSKRHADILSILEAEGTATIAGLAERLGVSLETVRRDVRPLTDAGTLLRVHGAVGLAGQVGEAPFQKRMRENAAAKQAIAKTVAAMVRDGDSLMLDTGTTTSFVARALTQHHRLTVVTNSTDIARILATRNGNRVFLAGGALRPDSGAAFGTSAMEFVAGFRTRLAILSAGAVDETGLTDYDLEEAELARLMVTCADTVAVVTDHSKFGRPGLIRVTGFDAIDTLVTDTPPPRAIATALATAGTTLALPLHLAENTSAGGT
jgi:DeoR family transcriptional regulator, glycerol-3-phosphate regulon repressor